MTSEELKTLADRVQDLAIDLSRETSRVSVMSPLSGIADAAAKLNQMIEAAAHMNRMLLSIASHAEDRANIEAEIRRRVKASANESE